MTIRALETRYAGRRFRSRLEARWAVFFDHVKIEWEYEDEAIETSAGNYLPDFKIRIPQIKEWRHQQWFEVKPPGAGEDPRHRALADESRIPVIVARGMPRSYTHQLRGFASPLVAYGVQDGADTWPVAFADSTSATVYREFYCSLGDNRHWCQEPMNETLLGSRGCHLALFGWHGPEHGWWPESGWTYPPMTAMNIDRAYEAALSARFGT